MVTFKKPLEIEKMRRAGSIVADILKLMKDMIRPGVDTLALDSAAESLLEKESAKAAFKGYRVPGIRTPFPGSICVSINDEVVHGIPSKDRVLEEGDIVSVDVGSLLDGYYGDAACTYAVGAISEARRWLVETAHKSLYIGLEQVAPGNTVGDIGHAVESWVISRGCGLVRDYAGHGIGRRLHEPPQVPNHGKPGSGVTLKPGMTFCVEPMVMSGKEPVRNLEDGWTVATVDGSDAAHFEHALLVTEEGYEILTPWE